MISLNVIPFVAPEIVALLEADKKSVGAAQKRAKSKTVLWLKRKTIRDLAAFTQFPRALIARRVFSNPAGRVWVGLFDTKPSEIGETRQADGGVYAGKYFFKGAFIQTMPQGGTSVFRRENNKMKKVMLPLIRKGMRHTATNTTDEEINKEYQKNFEQELRFEMLKRV